MRSSWIRAVVAAAAAGGLVGVTACSHIRDTVPGLHSSEEAACPPGQACADDAKVGKNPTVRALASDLDRLEKHIECYGSVTAKVPDVWGQARLTQYREDFEAQMKAELTTFNVELQGNSARSDQSYLAAALSLGLAAQPSAPVIGSVTTGNKSVSIALRIRSNVFHTFHMGCTTIFCRVASSSVIFHDLRDTKGPRT